MTWSHIAIEAFFALVGVFALTSIIRDVRKAIRTIKLGNRADRIQGDDK